MSGVNDMPKVYTCPKCGGDMGPVARTVYDIPVSEKVYDEVHFWCNRCNSEFRERTLNPALTAKLREKNDRWREKRNGVNGR